MNINRFFRLPYTCQSRFLSSVPAHVPAKRERFAPAKPAKREAFTRCLLLKYEQIFASRRDLQEFLGDVRPVGRGSEGVDAVLSKMLYPSGRWIVEVTDADATVLAKRAKADPFERLTVQYLTKTEVDALPRSTSSRIFRNCLRLRSTGSISKTDIHYIFEDFGVTFPSIRILQVSNDKFPDFLISFSNFNDALNAHKQKDGMHVDGHNISLTLYDI
jgi:hypothetical protein